MKKPTKTPINVNVEIKPEALKQLAEEGRLSEFVDAFPALVAGHLKTELVNQLTSKKGVKFVSGFILDDMYGTKPPRPFPRNEAMARDMWAMRRLVQDELTR